MKKHLVSSLLTLFSLALLPTAALAGNHAKPTAESVITKHLEAMGGTGRLQSAKTFQSTAVSYEGDKQVSTVTIHRARPNMVRYDVDQGGKKMTKAFDGTQGWWAEGSAAPQQASAEKSAKMAEGAFFDDALVDSTQRGMQVTLAGVEDVKGAPAVKLVLTRGSDTQTRYLDKKTMLEVKRVITGTHEGKSFTKTVHFSDYRSVDGIMVSHLTEWEADGKKGRTVLQTVRYDAPVEASLFQMGTPRS